jgi:hypothetical protein
MPELNQKITAVLHQADGERVVLRIQDWTEEDANTAAVAFDDGDFTFDDLLGALYDAAIVEIEQGGTVRTFSGAEFRAARLNDEYGVFAPTTVTFEDIAPAAA